MGPYWNLWALTAMYALQLQRMSFRIGVVWATWRWMYLPPSGDVVCPHLADRWVQAWLMGCAHPRLAVGVNGTPVPSRTAVMMIEGMVLEHEVTLLHSGP